MDQYFSRMRSLMNNKDLPARIRFLLQNTVELRANTWVARKAYVDNGPKTINQVRQDAVKVRPIWKYFSARIYLLLNHSMVLIKVSLFFLFFSFFLSWQDLGVFIPPQHDAMRNDYFMDNPSFLPTRIKFDREMLGGLADMFGQMPGKSSI